VEQKTKYSIWYVIIAIWGVLLMQQFIAEQLAIKVIPYSQFLRALKEGKVTEVAIGKDIIQGRMKVDSHGEEKVILFKTIRVEPALSQQLEKYNVTFRGEMESTLVRDLFSWIFPILFFTGIWYLLIGRMGPRAGFMSFGRSKAKIYAEDETGVSFEDVAGCDEAKEELKEVVMFLKEPERFIELGAQIPKGVLLVGPPGTGKTLLARAVAGEAKVPFFSIAGSEFVEMFVGVGAARVRDLFTQAKQKAPCIVFIDEIDAIGKMRGSHPMGGEEEREQTLNQLLVELDGFEPNQGVIILAATNRPEVLDPALLRPGRFDRQILVDAADLNGREAILRVHARNKPLAPDVDLRAIAARTPGFSGADLANVMNEAALLAARRGSKQITQKDFEDAVEKVVAGPERKSRRLNEDERRRVAYHESGHALVAHLCEHGEPVAKISIIPRGKAALGYTLQLPEEERFLMTRSEILDKICSTLGGRAAEEVVFGEISSGAQNDLEKATEMARSMVCRLGMSEEIGPVALVKETALFLKEAFPKRPEVSEEWMAKVDEEVKRILEEQYERAKSLLSDHRNPLEKVANVLMEKEVLNREEFEKLVEDVEKEVKKKS